MRVDITRDDASLHHYIRLRYSLHRVPFSLIYKKSIREAALLGSSLSSPSVRRHYMMPRCVCVFVDRTTRSIDPTQRRAWSASNKRSPRSKFYKCSILSHDISHFCATGDMVGCLIRISDPWNSWLLYILGIPGTSWELRILSYLEFRCFKFIIMKFPSTLISTHNSKYRTFRSLRILHIFKIFVYSKYIKICNSQE